MPLLFSTTCHTCSPSRGRHGDRSWTHTECIDRRLAEGLENCVVLLRELRTRGYQGSYTVLVEYVRPRRRGHQPEATMRFETVPGEQALVDWGSFSYVMRLDDMPIFVYHAPRRSEAHLGLTLELRRSAAYTTQKPPGSRFGLPRGWNQKSKCGGMARRNPGTSFCTELPDCSGRGVGRNERDAVHENPLGRWTGDVRSMPLFGSHGYALSGSRQEDLAVVTGK